MRTFTTLTAIVLAFVAFASMLATVAIPAHASADDSAYLTVRIVDQQAVNQELGECDAGRQIVVMANGRTHFGGHGVTEMTVSPIRPTVAMSVQLECDGQIQHMPSRGVEINFN